jgi:hypothetical protein
MRWLAGLKRAQGARLVHFDNRHCCLAAVVGWGQLVEQLGSCSGDPATNTQLGSRTFRRVIFISPLGICLLQLVAEQWVRQALVSGVDSLVPLEGHEHSKQLCCCPFAQCSFVVWRPAEFARDLLPLHFKHNNFSKCNTAGGVDLLSAALESASKISCNCFCRTPPAGSFVRQLNTYVSELLHAIPPSCLFGEVWALELCALHS